MKTFKQFKMNENKNKKIIIEKENWSKSKLINIDKNNPFFNNDLYYFDDSWHQTKIGDYVIINAFLNLPTLASNFDFGWFVFKNDELIYTVYIYEPHGVNINFDRNLILFYGHETIITLWTDTDNFEKIYTN